MDTTQPTLKMTIPAALEFADEWAKGCTFHEGSQGWRVVCSLLAGEVRRLQTVQAEDEALKAQERVLGLQRDSLRDALAKVLETRDCEAKAAMSYQNALENFSDCVDERKAHERAMRAAGVAERKARVLLLTLREDVKGGA